MPSDVQIGLVLSTIDRLSAHVPDIVSTSELEAIRTILTEAAEADSLRVDLSALQTEANKKIDEMTATINGMTHDYNEQVHERSEAFRYDGSIGTALILLRDAVMGRRDEVWVEAAREVVNEMFGDMTYFTNPDAKSVEPDELAAALETARRSYPTPSPERQMLLDRFEEAVAVHRIPGATARAVEIFIRAGETDITYDEMLSKLAMSKVRTDAAIALCDLVFMQDGNPDSKSWGMTEEVTYVSETPPDDSPEEKSEEE